MEPERLRADKSSQDAYWLPDLQALLLKVVIVGVKAKPILGTVASGL